MHLIHFVIVCFVENWRLCCLNQKGMFIQSIMVWIPTSRQKQHGGIHSPVHPVGVTSRSLEPGDSWMSVGFSTCSSGAQHPTDRSWQMRSLAPSVGIGGTPSLPPAPWASMGFVQDPVCNNIFSNMYFNVFKSPIFSCNTKFRLIWFNWKP